MRFFQWFAGMNVVVRGGDLPALAASMRGIVLSLNPDMPPFNVRTLDDEVSSLVAAPRFSASVLATFAIVALVMAAIGVYGVMAYTAGQWMREIGIRVALGTERASAAADHPRRRVRRGGWPGHGSDRGGVAGAGADGAAARSHAG